MKTGTNHKLFCFAGQPAACEGYFRHDVLPCVCGVESDAVTTLRGVVPASGGGAPDFRDLAAIASVRISFGRMRPVDFRETRFQLRIYRRNFAQCQ